MTREKLDLVTTKFIEGEIEAEISKFLIILSDAFRDYATRFASSEGLSEIEKIPSEIGKSLLVQKKMDDTGYSDDDDEPYRTWNKDGSTSSKGVLRQALKSIQIMPDELGVRHVVSLGLYMSKYYLRRARLENSGPSCFNIGRKIIYPKRAVILYINKCLKEL